MEGGAGERDVVLEGRPGKNKERAHERKMKEDRKPEKERGRVAVCRMCFTRLFARCYEFLMQRVTGLETPAACLVKAGPRVESGNELHSKVKQSERTEGRKKDPSSSNLTCHLNEVCVSGAGGGSFLYF